MEIVTQENEKESIEQRTKERRSRAKRVVVENVIEKIQNYLRSVSESTKTFWIELIAEFGASFMSFERGLLQVIKVNQP